jgi:hypothetical protein
MTPALQPARTADSNESPGFIQSGSIRAFWVHIVALMNSKGIIKAEDFDLMDVHRLAPDIMICDVDFESCRQNLRFVGTRIVDLFGAEPTGRYLDEIDLGPYRSQQLAAFSMAVASGSAQWVRVCAVGVGERPNARIRPSGNSSYERLIVPLVGDDSMVVQLVSIMRFADITCENGAFEHREIVPTMALESN